MRPVGPAHPAGGHHGAAYFLVHNWELIRKLSGPQDGHIEGIEERARNGLRTRSVPFKRVGDFCICDRLNLESRHTSPPQAA